MQWKILSILIFFSLSVAGQRCPDDLADKVTVAYQSLDENKRDKEFNKLLKKYDHCFWFWASAGNEEYKNRRYETAVEYLLNARAIDTTLSNSGYIKGVLAESAMRSGSYNVAYEMSLELKENNKKWEQIYRHSRFAREAICDTVDIELHPLHEKINTPVPEYQPFLTPDNGYLFFTRRLYHQEDIFASKKTDTGFTAPFPAGFINSASNESGITISASGEIYYALCEDPAVKGGCDIFYTQTGDNNKFKTAESLTSANSNYYDGQPSLSTDGRMLFFVSDRPGGFGGRDLYLMQKDSKGFWSVPENLGNWINTPGDEEAPFLHPDNRTLYFMSDHHPGFGGADLFRADIISRSGVINIGSPINSYDNEGAMTVASDGKTAYYSKEINRNYDLYSFIIPEEYRAIPVHYFSIKVLNKQTGDKLSHYDLAVQTVDSTGENLRIFLDSLLNRFPFTTQDRFRITVSAKDFIPRSLFLDASDFKGIKDPVIEIGLSPVRDTQHLVLNNIEFEFASAELKREALPELELVKKHLDNYPRSSVIIHGHTDTVGTEESNYKLSIARATAIREWLADAGIDRDRMNVIGHGESMPRNTDEKSRRVKINIIKQDGP